MTAVVQSASGRATTGSVTATFGAAPTNGNFIYAVLGTNSGTAQTAPTGYTQIMKFDGTSTTFIVWRKQAGASEPTGLTYTPSTGSQWDLHIIEVSGLTAPVIDKNPTTNTGSTSATTATWGPTGTLAGSADFCLLIASFNANVTGVTTPGFATLQNTNRMSTAYMIDTDQSSKSSAVSWTTATRVIGTILCVSPVAVNQFIGWGMPA
jgi:hypothetical protein